LKIEIEDTIFFGSFEKLGCFLLVSLVEASNVDGQELCYGPELDITIRRMRRSSLG